MAVNSELLARVNFPLYCVRMLSDTHFLVGGGGGGANTGVANGVEIFCLKHDGEDCTAELVTKYDTGKDSVMSCCSFRQGLKTFVAVGAEEKVKLLELRMKLKRSSDEGEVVSRTNSFSEGGLAGRGRHSSVRQRRRSSCVDTHPLDVNPLGGEGSPRPSPTTAEVLEDPFPPSDVPPSEGTRGRPRSTSVGSSLRKPSPPPSKDDKKVVYDVTPGLSTVTDFSHKDPYQKVVGCDPSPKPTWLVTGGADGHLRKWNVSDLEKVWDVEAHTKEIDDVDVSDDGERIVTVIKDEIARVWCVETGKKLAEITFRPDPQVKYLFKRAKFAPIPDRKSDSNACFLISGHNPIGKSSLPAYIAQWNGVTFDARKRVKFNETISALATSPDGTFVAVGSMFTGSVAVYVAFSLQQVQLVKNTHKSFVTGLAFVPRAMTYLTGPYEASVVSISVDNAIKVVHVKERRSVTVGLATTVSLLALVGTFVGLRLAERSGVFLVN
ncbi:unnamed protein product [Cyprideis torosa]|uniref:Uncharacterized protein n=1 Tax=Cyprideis torosa TaxID=163714 RepID=A0A7R8W2S4_9CRUS|nr:unnamed protein product [Cyprideis torosa]CAG0881358.1 unnamed protein product [Cyprideis torosa]